MLPVPPIDPATLQDPVYQRILRLAQRETDRYLDTTPAWVQERGRLDVVTNCLRHYRRPLTLLMLYRLTGEGRYREALLKICDWLIQRRRRVPDQPISVYFFDGVPERYAQGRLAACDTVVWGTPGYAGVLVQVAWAMTALDEAGEAPPGLMSGLRWLVGVECDKLMDSVGPLGPIASQRRRSAVLNIRFAHTVALLILREGFLGEPDAGGEIQHAARAIARRHRLSGGAHWERSTSYSQMVAYSEILLLEYLTHRDGRRPADLEPGIRQGFEWLVRMQRPDGRLFAFNDSTSAISIGPLFWAAAKFDEGRSQDLALRGLAELERDAEDFDERWVGKTGAWGLFDHAFSLMFFRPVQPVQPQLPREEVDQEAGLLLRRQGVGEASSVLLVKPINPVTNHGHQDAGLFEWWVDGRPVIVDRGANSYFTAVHHEWCQAAVSHPTIARAEDRRFDQPVYGLTGLVDRHRRQRTGVMHNLRIESTAQRWEARFLIAPYAGTRWERCLRWWIDRGVLEIQDHLESREPGAFDWLLPGLDPSLPHPLTREMAVTFNGQPFKLTTDLRGATARVLTHEQSPEQVTLAVQRQGARMDWSARLEATR